MKIRCTSHSIRVRVRKSELAELSQHRSITETLLFPNNQTFVYELAIGHNQPTVTATCAGNRMVVYIPEPMANTWMATSQVGIESTLALAGDDVLHVLVEKDFPCADRPNEDKSDTFWELTENAC